MENRVINQFILNFKEIVIDEIALEGLEGTTLDLLWRRVEKRFSTRLTERNKARIWSFIVNYKEVSFYEIPKPRARFEIVDRFSLVDEESGHILDPEDYPDGPYEYCPVKGDYGSCKDYETRHLLQKSENSLLGQVVDKYGDCFVLVASLGERWRALAPHLPITLLEALSLERYCMLELIGKGRENGQMSIGKTNLIKLFKDPKLLFYNKKPMQGMDLVTSLRLTQRSHTRGNKAILIRLRRFHKSRFASQPKFGCLHALAEYLKSKPDLSESIEAIINHNMINAKQLKQIRKSTILIFIYEELPIADGLTEPAPKIPRFSTSGVRKQISLALDSGESSDSDGESPSAELELKCQYNVGVGLLRQAYERILKAGLKGLSQLQLCQTLGIEFYTSRSICRTFKKRNIVREFLEDTGRQRTTRYIAIAATGAVDEEYAQEKQQLLDYLSKTNNEVDFDPEPSTSMDNDHVPRKKFKHETPENEDTSAVEEPNAITEVKTIEGLENIKGYLTTLQQTKGPTMRQLKYANGLIKVTRERRSVAGFQTLSTLVAKEINEPAMDTKALKTFVQKLVQDGQLKIFTIKWPGKNMCTNLICAPHVKITDPIVRTKYKEICMRAMITSGLKTKGKASNKPQRPLSLFAYPRYMKVRKLHEFLVKTIYFSGGVIESELPPGFASLLQIIPEMPVKLAIGHMSAMAMSHIMHLKLTETLLTMKLKDVPPNVYGILVQSRSLQARLRENLKILSTFGLIQLCHKMTTVADNYSNLLQYVFYVNRNAKVIDTTGTWPRADADLWSLEKRFRFDTYDDVVAYWDTVYEVAINTNIVDRVKTRYYPIVPVRQRHEVAQYDDATIYGDGRAAAGLDSIYFVDLQRNWETLNIINFQPILVRNPKGAKELKRGPKAKPPSQLKPKKPRKKAERQRRKPKKTVVVDTGKKRRRVLPMGKWEPWEDEIIMLCKAGMTIMSPNSQPGCLSVRNMVAKDLLNIHDKRKIANICHKRAVTLDSNSTLVHTNECLINEVRRRKQILAKYGGLLKKLRMTHSLNMAKYITAARVPLMELVMILYKIARSESFNKVTPCIAVNLEDFHRDFTITTATSNRPLNLYKTPEEFDTVISTIKEAVLMAMALKIDRELDEETSLKIYHILGMYTEKNIRVALEHLRKSGIVAAKEKFMHNMISRMTFKDAVQSSSTYQATIATYRISVFYARHMTCKFDTGFGDDLARTCEEPLSNPLSGSAAENCVLLERQACGLVKVGTVTPPTIIGSSLHDELNSDSMAAIQNIDSSLKLKTGVVGWQIGEETASEEGEVEYQEHLQTLVRSATVLPPNTKYPINDQLIEVLRVRKEKGATFTELRGQKPSTVDSRSTCTFCTLDCSYCKGIENLSGFQPTALNEKLNQLASKQMIKRVGFYDNVIVLTQYAKPWSIDLGDNRLIPSPWLSLNWTVNKTVFIKWCSVIVNTVCNYPGMSICGLASDAEAVTAKAVQEICVFLEKCKCVKLEVIREAEPDLFSGELVAMECDDFAEFESAKCIFVLPVRDTLTRFAKLRKCMLADMATD